MSEVDFSDVQGLVRFGYGRMTKACYKLVRVKSAPAARAWLGSAAISNAVETKTSEQRPSTALQVAFTAPGLAALDVPRSVIECFSHEFRGGMAQESRARQLGDIGSSAPEYWHWGRPGHEPHAVVMFFAVDGLEGHMRRAMGSGWDKAFERVHSLETSDLNEKEPFGFLDGISQPEIDWDQRRDTSRAQTQYTNLAAPGEFLLGYRNEYGKLTDRPLLEASVSTSQLLPALDDPRKRDLGRNGTYLVMRQIEQDVRAFWRFVYKEAGENQAEAERLAEAMVGRRTNGDPLVPAQEKPIPGIDAKHAAQNQFTYDGDPAGARCPIGAHIRRANPRNADFPEAPASRLKKLITVLGFGPNRFRYDLTSPTRFHRILRRGREYGSKMTIAAAIAGESSDTGARGLHFVCLNANISRQFEFVQNAWIAGTKFAGLTGESDPLLGNREPIPGCPAARSFTMQHDGGLRRRVSGLPQFVTVRGGAYFFLPGLRALQYIARI